MANRVARAKQFLPFDALKGLQEALREKEIEYEEKKDLSEDTLNELNNKFNQIDNGSFVKITFSDYDPNVLFFICITFAHCGKRQ